MCGIAGFLDDSGRQSAEELGARAVGMADRLVHRGPDSSGVWVDAAPGVALAHRRLAILDLSPEGAQPMRSADDRFVVTFNGEIYNHDELREELGKRGHRFRGHSDTEVLLAGCVQWGVREALTRSNGMFALGLWDRERRLLHLARDRMGEKPLYYGWFGGAFLFASEIKAVRAHPAFRGEIDRDVLAAYMRFGYVPGSDAIYRGLRRLPPGGLATISLASPGDVALARYWSAAEVAAASAERPFRGTPEEAAAELEALLRDSIRLRMYADVPLGAFLSGGVDSSTVVALMQAQSARPVKTFTIGFREDAYNEAEHAQAVARHLGTDHTELYLTAQDALEVVPKLPALYDEPFADSSQIPTFLVSRLARQHVTVSLSGDAGDELFCGYTRYDLAASLWRRIGWAPRAMRGAAARLIRATPPAVWARGLRLVEPLLPRLLRDGNRAHRIRAGADLLALGTRRETYRALVSLWREPESLVPGAHEVQTPLSDGTGVPRLPTWRGEMMYLDAVTYLPDDILVKVDRASMGVSLEARVPLLDHRLVEFAWRIPLDLKVREGTSKWLLRKVLYRHVPAALIERPKMGFGVPIEAWLREPLREWAEDLLSEARLRREGHLDPAPVRRKMEEHQGGLRNWHYHLWTVLMFEAWLAAETAT